GEFSSSDINVARGSQQVSAEIAPSSQETRNPCAHQTQDDGRGERNEKFPAKQAETKVAWQATEPQFVQPGREALYEDEGEKHNQQPTNHGKSSKAVGSVGLHKAHGRPWLTRCQCDDLEQFAHFMVLNQCLRPASLLHAGVFQQGQQTTVD
ncbi:MAG: hypothetical protein RIR85_815, partial [Pseudomonadota bacterium]